MKQEPVAIVNNNKENWIQWIAYPEDLNGYFLYTTPQLKELSDEEIHELIVNKVTDAQMIRDAIKKASEK